MYLTEEKPKIPGWYWWLESENTYNSRRYSKFPPKPEPICIHALEINGELTTWINVLGIVLIKNLNGKFSNEPIPEPEYKNL